MKRFRTMLAALVIAAAALVAAPAAANAYPPDDASCNASGNLTAGGTITLEAFSFDPGTTVSFVVNGENGAGVTLALVRAVNSNSAAFTATTNAQGYASVNVVLPSDAVGDYILTVTGVENGNANTETDPFSLTAAAGAGTGTGTGTARGPAATGVDSASLMGVWIGGGVLLLGGLAVTVFAVRRQRQDV